MPRMLGLSSLMTDWWRRRNPNALSVSFWSLANPMELLFKVTLICPIARSLLAQEFLGLFAPQTRHLFHRPQLLEPFDRRPHHVDGIGRTKGLGQHVADPSRLQHRPHRAAGDDARTFAGGLQKDLRSRKTGLYLVGDRRADQRDRNQVFLGVFDAFADRVGHLSGFPLAGAHVALAVAYRDHRGKRANPPTLHGLGDRVDIDDLFLELTEGVGIDALSSH